MVEKSRDCESHGFLVFNDVFRMRKAYGLGVAAAAAFLAWFSCL